MDPAVNEASVIMSQMLCNEGKDRKVDLRILQDMLQLTLERMPEAPPKPKGDTRMGIEIIKDFLIDRRLFSTLKILSMECGMKDYPVRSEVFENIGITGATKTVLETLMDLSMVQKKE